MANTIAQKLKIKEHYTLVTINAPGNFEKHLQLLPPGVNITEKSNKIDQVHWFVNNKAQLEKELDKVLSLVKGDVVCWTYYPKGTSKIQTDLTRDKGWDMLLKHDELAWISLISFDETWSTFGFRLKTDTDRKKEAQPKEREIFKYVDAATKEVRLPDDLAAAFRKHKPEAAIFDILSFSNRKEYIEWIITAKRPETRLQRIEGTIQKLGKGMKNPMSK